MMIFGMAKKSKKRRYAHHRGNVIRPLGSAGVPGGALGQLDERMQPLVKLALVEAAVNVVVRPLHTHVEASMRSVVVEDHHAQQQHSIDAAHPMAALVSSQCRGDEGEGKKYIRVCADRYEEGHTTWTSMLTFPSQSCQAASSPP